MLWIWTEFESLRFAIKRCYDFLLDFIRKNNEDISQLIAHYVAFHMSNESPKETEEDEIHFGRDFLLKSYLIFLQQINIYSRSGRIRENNLLNCILYNSNQLMNCFRILLRENLSLIYEYESCITHLQQLVERVHNTIKFKTAVSVVEIYVST